MATTLAPVDSRDVVRCDQCHLVQFKTVNNLCRRCRMSLEEDEPEPILTPCLPAAQVETSDRSEVQVAMAIRTLRQRNGLSQRQLALRMGELPLAQTVALTQSTNRHCDLYLRAVGSLYLRCRQTRREDGLRFVLFQRHAATTAKIVDG